MEEQPKPIRTGQDAPRGRARRRLLRPPSTGRIEGLARAFDEGLGALGVERVRVLVAVSGGRDSSVLLDLMVRAAGPRGLELVVGHVHHGLRGSAADGDAEWVEARACALGLPFRMRRVDPEAARRSGPSRTRPTLEEAARELRRAALLALADEAGCRLIATAHHAGDQAETLLLRLLRGTGPDGLSGMAPRSRDGRFIRPLLAVFPDALADWASAHALAWREDGSNRDLRHRRNRVRHELLPRLAEGFNPRILRALCDLAEAAREDRVLWEALVDEAAKERLAWSDSVLRFRLEGWRSLPEAVARRVVRRGLERAGLGREVSRAAIVRVLAFLRRERRAGRDKQLELPGGFSLRRVEDHFELQRSEPTRREGREPEC